MPTARETFRIAQRFDKTLAIAEDATILRVNEALLNSFVRLDRTLRLQWENLKEEVPFLPSERQLFIADQVGYLLQLINPSQAATIEGWYQELLNSSSRYGVKVADEILGDLSVFANIPVEAISYSAKESFERLKRHGQDFANKATIVVSEGLIQGWGVIRVSKALKEQLGITKWKAEQIARTESIKAYSAASQQKYDAAGVEEVIWVAVREGVCDRCTWRNGKAFKLGSVIHPGHPNCRCVLLPKVGDIADVNFWLQYSEQLSGDRSSDMMPFEKSAGFVIAPKPTWIPIKKNE